MEDSYLDSYMENAVNGGYGNILDQEDDDIATIVMPYSEDEETDEEYYDGPEDFGYFGREGVYEE